MIHYFGPMQPVLQALGPDLAIVSSFPESLQEAQDVCRPRCWSSADQGNANIWSELRMAMTCPSNGDSRPDLPAAQYGSMEPSLPPFLPFFLLSLFPCPARGYVNMSSLALLG